MIPDTHWEDTPEVKKKRKIQLKRPGSDDAMYPMFFRLSEERFYNWIISIDDLQIKKHFWTGNVTPKFKWQVRSVPKEVSDGELYEKQPDLAQFVAKMFEELTSPL